MSQEFDILGGIADAMRIKRWRIRPELQVERYTGRLVREYHLIAYMRAQKGSHDSRFYHYLGLDLSALKIQVYRTQWVFGADYARWATSLRRSGVTAFPTYEGNSVLAEADLRGPESVTGRALTALVRLSLENARADNVLCRVDVERKRW